MGIRGLEHTPLAGSEPRFGGSASQNAAHSEPMPGSEPTPASAPDPELSQIIRAWPTLSGWTRWQIRELIENESQQADQTGIEPKADQD